MNLTTEQQVQYLQLIAEGSARLDAAEQMEGVAPATILEALKDDDFRDAVELVEAAAVDDALYSAATSGNLPAIHAFFGRRRAKTPDDKQSAVGAAAEVHRLAETLRPLLKAPE